MTDDIVPHNPDANLPDHANRMQDLLGGLTNIANSIDEAGGVASGLPFIGINGNGVWAYGQERTEVEKRSLWAIDTRSWKHGYIAWPGQGSKDRKPLGERMVPANTKLPDLASLPDVGVAYAMQFGFEMLCLTGEDAGTLAMYKNGSYGAKALVKQLVDDVKAQARRDPTRMIPVVTLEIRSYFHPEWKKDFHNPVFAIAKWISFDEYDQFVPAEEGEVIAGPTPAPKEAPQPKVAARGNGRTAAPAPEPAQPVPQPARQRRPGARSQPV